MASEKGRLPEEGGQHLVADERRDHVADDHREAAPIRPECPLGSANDFSSLNAQMSPRRVRISNFSPMDGASDDRFEVTL